MEKWTRLLIILAATLLLLVFAGLLVRAGMLIHRTLLLFSLGALFAYALDPMVEALGRVRARRGGRALSRELRVLTVIGGLLLAFGLVCWTLGGHVVAQAQNLRRDYPTYSARARRQAEDTDAWLAQRRIPFSLVETMEHPPAEVSRFLNSVGEHALPAVGHFLTDVGESGLVLIIAIYFLIYGPEMRERVNQAFPEGHRHRAELWETDADRIIGGFVRGQLLIALTMGVLAALGCLVVGIHTWLLIGLFVAVTALIPVFGPVLGAIPAVIAAIVGPTHMPNPLAAAVVLVVMFTVISEIGSKVLYPRLVGQALGLHTVLVLFVLLAGLETGGIVGVLFAAPLTALARATAIHLYRFWKDLPDSLLVETPPAVEALPEDAEQPQRRPFWRRRQVERG